MIEGTEGEMLGCPAGAEELLSIDWFRRFVSTSQTFAVIKDWEKTKFVETSDGRFELLGELPVAGSVECPKLRS